MVEVVTRKDPHFEREAHKYVKPIPSREFIMEYLEEVGRPITRTHLNKAFALDDEETQEAMRRRLIAMLRDGQLMQNRRGSFVLVRQADLICGRVIKHRDGYGFLVPEDGSEDIFLSAREIRKVMSEDKVLVSVIAEDRKKKREGVIVEILERGITSVAGRYFSEEGLAFVSPVKKELTEDIIIPLGKEAGAKSGEMVIAEITQYPTRRTQAIGQVIEILGEELSAGMEIEVAIRSYELPYKWSEEVEKELSLVNKEISDDEFKVRTDFRHLPFVTIDGEDAKDFDDAVHCVPQENGGWILYVAIADVSHYVKSYTAIDQEALARGNSVYFPGKVVSMLPELLSNNLCSLKPEVDRLAVVCEMRINNEGGIGRFKFYDAVIKSHARLTYNQVYGVLERKTDELPELQPHLQALHEVYRALLKQRRKRGALEFKTVETRIIFDKEFNIERIEPVTLNYAHGIIEECMLAANVCASKFLSKGVLPALYRVHEEPDPQKLENVRKFLSNRGLTLGGGAKPKPEHYAELMDEITSRSDESLIQEMLLRSMRQALYMPENIGHFGLAYKSYAHFTSPIRRYPDLLNHRAIHWLLKNGDMNEFIYDNNDMVAFGEHCSMTERRADEATRDVTNWLKCKFMKDKVGEEYSGIITHVTNFGVFVELQDFYVEGLLHITSLYNDYYRYDPVEYSLKGKRYGKIYSLGDPIEVRIARVDVDAREMDFELVEKKEEEE